MIRKLTSAVFVAYLAVAFLTSGFYNTIPLLVIYSKTVSWLPLSFSLLLTVLIAWLVAVSTAEVYDKYRERKRCKKEACTAGIAAAGGLATGICPLCITGLFPILFGVFGISFSFASLPLKGIEVQLLVAALLLISLYTFRKSKPLNS